jgi:WD40 repeat protein
MSFDINSACGGTRRSDRSDSVGGKKSPDSKNNDIVDSNDHSCCGRASNTNSTDHIAANASKNDNNNSTSTSSANNATMSRQRSRREQRTVVRKVTPVSYLATASRSESCIHLWRADSSWNYDWVGCLDCSSGSTGNSCCIADMEFSIDGSMLATAGQDNLLRVWNVAAMKTMMAFECPQVRKVQFSHTGEKLLFTAGTGRIGNCSLRVPGREAEVSIIREQQHSSIVVLGACYNYLSTKIVAVLVEKNCAQTLLIWNAETKEAMVCIRCRYSTSAIALSFTEDALAIGTDSGFVALWNLSSVKETHSLTPWKQARTINQLCFSNFVDGHSRLAAVVNENNVCVWDVAGGALLISVTCHGDSITSLSLNSPVHNFACGLAAQGVVIIDAVSGVLLKTLPLPSSIMNTDNASTSTSDATSPNGNAPMQSPSWIVRYSRPLFM